FEPFFSTKGEGGSGLGLAMAYSIVKRHGGEIGVERESGRGTTFTLTFPGAAQISGPSGAPDRTAPRRIARVLVIDDDPQVLATLSEILRSLGHRVTAAPSGPAALAGYARDRFDVVLTNVGMAGMNGWEFAERLRAVDSQVALLFITGWGLREDDNPDALDAARRWPDRFAVMGRFDPTARDAEARLQRWREQPGMRGMRFTFHLPPSSGWLADGSLDWFWAAAERVELPLMVSVPGQPGKIAGIAQRHPRLRFILDHMARPRGLKDDAAFADLDDLLA